MLTALAVFCFTVSAHAANILIDGGFEAAAGGNVYYSAPTNQSIDGGSWIVTAGEIYIDNLDPYVYAGNNSLNLTGANPYQTDSIMQATRARPFSAHAFRYHVNRSVFLMAWFVWALLSAIFAAATALLAKLGVTNVDPNLATAVRTTVVVLFAWSITLTLGTYGGLIHIQRRSWLFLVASGFATGLSWICYFRALSLGQASKVAPIDKLSVVFVILLAAPILGEAFTTQKVIGGLLIAIGAIVLAF